MGCLMHSWWNWHFSAEESSFNEHFDTNHKHRHSFAVILEYSNMEPRVRSTYILEITLTASKLEPTLDAVLKRKRIHAINVHYWMIVLMQRLEIEAKFEDVLWKNLLKPKYWSSRINRMYSTVKVKQWMPMYRKQPIVVMGNQLTKRGLVYL